MRTFHEPGFLFGIIVTNITVLLTPCTSQEYPHPSFRFYHNSECSGEPYRTDQGSTTFPLNQNNWRPTAFAFTGLWHIQPCNTSDFSSCPLPPPQKGWGTTCIEENFEGLDYLRIHPFDQAPYENKINFYSGNVLNGSHNAYTTPIDRVSQTFGSLFFTGNYSWTIYTDVLFSGNALCLLPDEDVHYEMGYGATFIVDLELWVGSFNQGCHSNETLTPTTANPISTTPPSDSSAESTRLSQLLVLIILIISYVT